MKRRNITSLSDVNLMMAGKVIPAANCFSFTSKGSKHAGSGSGQARAGISRQSLHGLTNLRMHIRHDRQTMVFL